MHFRICLATLPAVYRESVADAIALVEAGLLDNGHGVTVDESRAILDGSAINLFIDYFEAEQANALIGTKRAKSNDFRFGILALHAPSDPDRMSGDFAWRADGLRRVADAADFVWHLMPDVETSGLVDPAKCAGVEVGSSARLATLPLQSIRDVDFFLPGFPYPYRQTIVGKLDALGYHVRSGDLTTPAYLHRALMARAKIVLDLRRSAGTPHLSPLRIAMAANNGLAVASERFDTSALGDLYAYTTAFDTDEFTARCVELIEHHDPIALGRAARECFARERPLAPLFARLLAATPIDA